MGCKAFFFPIAQLLEGKTTQWTAQVCTITGRSGLCIGSLDGFERILERMAAALCGRSMCLRPHFKCADHVVTLSFGDRLMPVSGHCDPTVNLYDQLMCVRSERVEAIWPISARGGLLGRPYQTGRTKP